MAVLVRRIVLQNYKSIAGCDVFLKDVSVFVGLNGSGKSNFLDALKLVSESLKTTLEHAIRQRGSIKEVRRKSSGHPTHFGIRLELTLESDLDGVYTFRVGAMPNGDFTVQKEKALIYSRDLTIKQYSYHVENGQLINQSPEHLVLPPEVSKDRLFLPSASANPNFRVLHDALVDMNFYNVNPTVIRLPQVHGPGDVLAPDANNIAAVIRRLESSDQYTLERINEYLRIIVPGIESVNSRSLGPQETLEFRQTVPGARNPWRFFSGSMSDGTLKALGVLVALFQSGIQNMSPRPLIGIEEPESTIHPGAARVLMDALLECSSRVQVLVTTHSPDLLDHEAIESESIFVVRNVEGKSIIAPADRVSVSAIKDKLYTAGELLRQNQLSADVREEDTDITQTDLFSEKI